MFFVDKKSIRDINTIIKHDELKFSGICDACSCAYSKKCDSCGAVFVFFRVSFEKRRRSRRGSASGRRR